MPVKILMADGDPAALDLARSTISTIQWCELVTVDDGNEALDLLNKEKFDGLIIADQIPHVARFEIVQRLKYSPLNSTVPIVMLTERDDVDAMRKGFQVGVTFFAIKPENRRLFQRLLSAVRGAMEAERRRHHRLPYRTPVICRLGEGRSQFKAESSEICEGGISVSPTGGVEVGQVLELEFLVPRISRPAAVEPPRRRKSLFPQADTTLVELQKIRARVRYLAADGESMGLDFLGLTPSQREAIQQYIAGGG